MTISNGALPPPLVLESILRKITETLAGELAHPTRTAPDWSGIEWLLARAVCAMHGVSPLLSRVLRWQGPPGWNRFLDQQRVHTIRRHERIVALLREIDRRAIAANIAALAMKGAALHDMGLYETGDRPMADIDLLVRPVDASAAARLIETLGYQESGASWKERVFNPVDAAPPGELGEHSGNIVKIELHVRICEKLPWGITDASQWVFPGESHRGLNAYPSKASLMLHLLLHAAGSMTTRALRLIHLSDLARLSSQMTAKDWDTLLELRSQGERLWWAFPPLELASRYFSAAIPLPVLTSLAGECPFWLRRIAARRTLFDVSYSYLWVDAFPGIEWSHSLHELFGYMASRLLPDAGHAALRAQNAKTQAWAADSPWVALPQRRRVLRWLTSRPLRAPTMHAVRAAIAQASGRN